EDLARVRERRTLLARPPRWTTRLVRFSQRRPAMATLLLLLATTIAAALIVAGLLLPPADRGLQRADPAQQFVDHLADDHRLRLLLDELANKLSIDSRSAKDCEDWWQRASEVLDRLPSHRDFLDQLRSQALPRDQATPVDAATQQRVREAENRLSNLRSR